ncbi:MAG TPA: hypothetical protein VLG36_04575 [Candidatus Chromulinivoraceae bacterium]|nr:hypothetical protein [Candidatus Chromulinivoraceae bacterium]
MILLKELPEPYMVAAFLKAEYYSERFSDDLNQILRNHHIEDAQLITDPDCTNGRDNTRRAQILGDYRGYKQNREIFTDFPEHLVWYQAELTPEEVGELHYVDYSYWNELSNNTHLVKDAVKNIKKGTVVFDVSNDRFFDVAKDIEERGYTYEPMVFTGHDETSALTILEGHMRATAIGLAGSKAPKVIPAIVGYEVRVANI